MSRSNSMTNAGQCRLAPLIVCIQDSSQCYDYIVKLLFKLHNCKYFCFYLLSKLLFLLSYFPHINYMNQGLPPDTLEVSY